MSSQKSKTLFFAPFPPLFRKIDERKSLLNGDFQKKKVKNYYLLFDWECDISGEARQ